MGRYTASDDPRADPAIERQLQRIVAAILEIRPDPLAIILVGAFGRGEGSVACDAQGVRALNDYDVLVIADGGAGRQSLRDLGRSLAGEFGIDFVDIGLLSPTLLETLEPTLFHYDLRYGSQVLCGGAGPLERIPRYAPEQLRPWEAVQLLLNRMAGILGALDLHGNPPRVCPRDHAYFHNQVVKALLACGDAVIIQAGAYHVLYRERRALLRKLAGDGELSWVGEMPLARIDAAYADKLVPGAASWGEDLAVLLECLAAYEAVFLRCLSRYLGETIASPAEAWAPYLRRHRSGRLARLLAPLRPAVGVPARHVAYACLPLVLFSIPLWRQARTLPNGSARRVLGHVPLRGRIPPGSREADWEALRRAAVELWEKHCHG
jgi:hypothetical protein